MCVRELGQIICCRLFDVTITFANCDSLVIGFSGTNSCKCVLKKKRFLYEKMNMLSAKWWPFYSDKCGSRIHFCVSLTEKNGCLHQIHYYESLSLLDLEGEKLHPCWLVGIRTSVLGNVVTNDERQCCRHYTMAVDIDTFINTRCAILMTSCDEQLWF